MRTMRLFVVCQGSDIGSCVPEASVDTSTDISAEHRPMSTEYRSTGDDLDPWSRVVANGLPCPMKPTATYLW